LDLDERELFHAMSAEDKYKNMSAGRRLKAFRKKQERLLAEKERYVKGPSLASTTNAPFAILVLNSGRCLFGQGCRKRGSRSLRARRRSSSLSGGPSRSPCSRWEGVSLAVPDLFLVSIKSILE
jgi:hypothetical protein